MRIFIGPHEVAGYYGNLSSGLRKVGVDCDFVEFIPHSFKYSEGEASHFLIRWARHFNRRRGKAGRSLAARALYALPGEVLRLLYFPVALFGYDVFLFGFGRTLLWKNADLPVLKWLGKRVIVNMAHGSELRPPYMDGGYQSGDGRVQPTPAVLAKVAAHHKRQIRFLEKYADVIIGAPLSSSQFTSKPFVNSCALGIPLVSTVTGNSQGLKSDAPKFFRDRVHDGQGFRILHCPSHPALKGSALIRSAVDALRQKGFDIDFVELTGRPNSDIIAAIRQCDLVIDQVYSDTPLASLGMETAYFGKPVVVGGYGFEELRKHVPAGMWPPAVTSRPAEIEKTVEHLLRHPDEMRAAGRTAQIFVLEKWSSDGVALRFKRLIDDQIPGDWFIRPEAVHYVGGVGQPLELTCAHIRGLVEQFGVPALQLSDRPSLEQACLDLVATGEM